MKNTKTTLKTQIRQEFSQQSAINQQVFRLAVEFAPDLEIDPITKEINDTPLDNILGGKYTRFTHQAKPNRLGACFIQESGEVWQVKIFSDSASVINPNHSNHSLNKPNPSNQSLINQKRKNKRSGQYYAPKGIGDTAYLPPVPRSTVLAIAQRYNLTPPTEQESFWDWFKQHKNIPLALTEGGKKTLAAISIDIPTVSLYGCTCGVKNKDERGKKIALTLIPELQELCANRVVNIAFDRDTKHSAKKAVRKGINKLGRAIKKVGGKPFIVQWDAELGKGMDDLIATQGANAFISALEKAIPFEKWQMTGFTEIKPDLILKERYFPNIHFPENAQLIGIKSAKNTGKTERLTLETEKAIAQGQRVLVITHRIQLAKALCHRFGIDHIEEIYDSETKGILGYGLCIDSLHPYSHARFNPDDWEEALVIFDECEQVLWHLLNAKTCKYYRVPILENLTQLVQTVIESEGRIILSDADLSAISLNYFERLADQPLQRYIVENQYNPNLGKRILYTDDSPQALLNRLYQALAKGDNLLVHTSAQKADSQWSAQNIELLARSCFPDLKILRIDSETITEPNHPAYGIMGHLDEVLPQYQLVLASPTIETGISITLDHFDAVYCFAMGNQTVNAVCQTLERLRTDVPRYLYASKASANRVGNGSSDPYSLLKSQQSGFKANRSLLKAADDWACLDDEHPEHLHTWVKLAALHNYGFRHYRQSLLEKLQMEGYSILEGEQLTEEEQEMNDALVTQLKGVQKGNYGHQCQKISKSPNPSDEKLTRLQESKAKTPEERYEQRKGELCRQYQTEEITPEMVDKDNKGWFAQLTLHYYLTVGKPFLKNREAKKAKKLTEYSNGKVFTPDANKTFISAQIRCLELMDIHQFFNTETIFTSDSLREWLERLKTPDNRRAIKTFINQTLSDKDSPIGFAQRILGAMGLKLTCIGIFTENGKKVRKYRMENLNPDGRNALFERWLQNEG